MASSDSIEAFVLLAKSAKGRAATEVIREVLGSPSAFQFGELLEQPNILELSSSGDPEHKKWFDLLQIFAYGTLSDYLQNRSMLPELSEKALYKLKKLTVVSLAANVRVLPYDVLLKHLDIDNVRSLEDLLIDSMYQGIIRGKLDQKAKHIEIFEAIGRDLRPGDMNKMAATLSNWLMETEKTLLVLEKNANNAMTSFETHKKQQEDFQTRVEELKRTIKSDLQDSESRGPGSGHSVLSLMGLGSSEFGSSGGGWPSFDDETESFRRMMPSKRRARR